MNQLEIGRMGGRGHCEGTKLLQRDFPLCMLGFQGIVIEMWLSVVL